ncbi:hypothetical protein OH76DRAFT_1484308 [Lentinus brumalis]|uniref:Uncharacterized protein n=1 Tax=Lentinus brumalis TaxID=2498619 RepID=A0A371D5Q4_9APHY|nr:hypothetical protein OH76DRAFT_1484308 [Polyporus brumalis]
MTQQAPQSLCPHATFLFVSPAAGIVEIYHALVSKSKSLTSRQTPGMRAPRQQSSAITVFLPGAMASETHLVLWNHVEEFVDGTGIWVSRSRSPRPSHTVR